MRHLFLGLVALSMSGCIVREDGDWWWHRHHHHRWDAKPPVSAKKCDCGCGLSDCNCKETGKDCKK